jgi:SAM-dependent methyltransferase
VRKNKKVIKEFGNEWTKFKNNLEALSETLEKQFKAYSIPLSNFSLPEKIHAADFGAGSGRWDKYFAQMVNQLTIVEPSEHAIAVCRENLKNFTNVIFKNETIERCTIPEESLDLAISLGVLHHTDNTEFALKKISRTLKPGGIFLCYLYYNLENKSRFYRFIWRISDFVRIIFSKLPKFLKLILSELIAIAIYLPLARFSLLIEKLGKSAVSIPLHHYAKMPLYILRNDALDRFGTQVERRFSQAEISKLLLRAGFDVSTLHFSDSEPFWTFAVRKCH